MAETIPTYEPAEFVSGETVQWKKVLSDYPAGTWTLSYDFVNASASFAESSSVADGTDHLVTINAASAPSAGTYSWQAWVTDGSTSKVVSEGTLVVKPKLSAGTAFDNRTWAQKCLDAIEAAIESRASEDQLSMSIAGRSISKMTLEEMIIARDRFKSEVAREQAEDALANGFGNPSKVRLRF